MNLIIVEYFKTVYGNTDTIVEEVTISPYEGLIRITNNGLLPFCNNKLIRGTLHVKTALHADVVETIVSPLAEYPTVKTVICPDITQVKFYKDNWYYRTIVGSEIRVYISLESTVTAVYGKSSGFKDKSMITSHGYNDTCWIDGEDNPIRLSRGEEPTDWITVAGTFTDSDLAMNPSHYDRFQVKELEGNFIELPESLHPISEV